MSLLLIGAGPSDGGQSCACSGLQDFTSYTEVDPNSRIVVNSATKITVTQLPRNEDSRVYYDCACAPADDFDHDLETTCTDSSSDLAIGPFWAVSNVVDDGYYWAVNNSQAVQCYWYVPYGGASVDIRIYDTEVGASDASVSLSKDTKYYVTIDRPSATQVRCRIYSDSSRTTLVDTLTDTTTSGRTWDHFFAVNAWNGTPEGTVSFEVESLHIYA
ncbi:MAG: hypothetical protein U9Q07_12300 [Planctomycetota bacterium]|nr:hypothetical protein [Planctomycetota bacterium]